MTPPALTDLATNLATDLTAGLSAIAPTRTDVPIAIPVDGAALADDLLTPEVAALIGVMQRVHGHSQRTLLQRRTERAAALVAGAIHLELDPATASVRDSDWSVTPAPAALADRRVEITGPVERKMMIGALNSGAKVFMADLEDSMAPTWANVLDGHRNLRDASNGTIDFVRPDGTVDVVNDDPATLTVRPRGLHMVERHVTVDGEPVSSALFDLCVAASNVSPLYLYLPKLESYHEAEWWDAVLADVERRLGLPVASIRVTVLIETITASFQMDEILHALQSRITGLNAGRWDYIFSTIKLLGHRPEHLLPDRGAITMTVPFMAAYAQRLVATCHRRGAHAIGGMAAFVPNRRDVERNERALAQVQIDKEREAGLGYDGTWVAHPDLVPVARAAFDEVLGARANQLDRRPAIATEPAALIDTTIPGAAITVAGLTTNVRVALQYLEAWLGGRGAVAINDLMEDAATAEISRSQLWQWVRLGAALDDGTLVTVALVDAEIDAQQASLAEAGHDAGRLVTAAEVLREVTLADELPPFLTTIAARRLG